MPQTDLFEMRRLEMLSNTIFGVAMTLLAYDLPKASSFKQAPPGSTWFASMRNRSSRWRSASSSPACSGSAITGGLRWRRKPGAAWCSSICSFCSSIIILPVTNGLYGSYRLDGVIAVIYGLHLTMIAVGMRCCGFSRCAAATIRY